ncbi:hypothetical protein FHR32_007088 [Streptosporangium album]|uniref:DUF742 domain-containing protein n=1 Tax=Streptosporangium album TaxID=47479 RepID=A0A7W7WDD3_9ACTN|nr:DUF742 domain-containing protein [Streptosporangium album]MBB4942688.1 hypothetical protein [Streptosporangium album]
MSAHRRQRRRHADGPRFHPLAFGGWGDYKTWAEHQFLPKPIEDLPDGDARDGDARDGDARDGDIAVEDAPPGDAQEQRLDDGDHQDVGTPIPETDPERPFVMQQSVGPRPYILPLDDDSLRIDSLISVTPEGVQMAQSPTLSDDYRLAFDMCRQPTPVIEIAARLRMPIGVVLVLVSKAIGWNLVKVLPPAEADGQPSLELIIRVYEGLRRLN